MKSSIEVPRRVIALRADVAFAPGGTPVAVQRVADAADPRLDSAHAFVVKALALLEAADLVDAPF
jgi:hypothetical protein